MRHIQSWVVCCLVWENILPVEKRIIVSRAHNWVQRAEPSARFSFDASPLPRAMGSGTWYREEQCMGWVEVMCTAPPHAAGVVTVEVSATDGGFSTSKVEFAYEAAAVVLSLQPSSGASTGVGVVKVGGKHLIGAGVDALCGFGTSDPVHAEMVSSALVKCEAPAHAPGMVSLEMSTSDEGQQFSHSGMVYEYADEEVVVGLEPRKGPQGGGTVVRMALSIVDGGASSVSSCRFGTIGPLVGRRGGGGAECAAPAHEGGLVAVMASSNDEVYGASEVAYEYRSSAVVYAVAPEAGPVGGGTVVRVMGSGLRGETVQCRFGLEVVDGEYVGGEEMCVTSARASASMVESFYGLNSDIMYNSDLAYNSGRPISLYGLEPDAGLGIPTSNAVHERLGLAASHGL